MTLDEPVVSLNEDKVTFGIE